MNQLKDFGFNSPLSSAFCAFLKRFLTGHSTRVKNFQKFLIQFFFRFRPFSQETCFSDVSQVIFSSPGVFHLNTSLMEMYVPYVFSVFVKKGTRESEFRQSVVVKEGDPPDFFIK